MKKFILGAVAAGALAVGGAASAQGLGGILDNIFGYGSGNQGYSQSQPAVVAGTVPHGTQGSVPHGTQLYADQYGRQFYYDQYGRQVFVQTTTTTSSHGIVGYDSWGRPVYGTTNVYNNVYGSNHYGGYAANRSWDRDGDGIANTRDRWPDDGRYW